MHDIACNFTFDRMVQTSFYGLVVMDMQTAGPGSQDCITGLKLWTITTSQNSSTTRHVSTTCAMLASWHALQM